MADSAAIEGQGGTDLVVEDRATGTGTSTEAGRVAEAEIVTVIATTGGLDTAPSHAADSAAEIVTVTAGDMATVIAAVSVVATVTGAKVGDAGTASRTS